MAKTINPGDWCKVTFYAKFNRDHPQDVDSIIVDGHSFPVARRTGVKVKPLPLGYMVNGEFIPVDG